MRVEIVEGEEIVFGVNVGHPIATNWNLVILCREGWRRGSSQITLGFLVIVGFYHVMHYSAKRGLAIACRLSSVCLSVCDVGGS